MTIVPLATVKARLSEFVSRVTLTVHGRPSAVLISVEDLESLEETLAVLADTDAIRRMTASEVEIAGGDAVSAAELAEAMAARRSEG